MFNLAQMNSTGIVYNYGTVRKLKLIDMHGQLEPKLQVRLQIRQQRAKGFHQVQIVVDKKRKEGASLVALWLRICLPMQGTRVRALVWEDPTCRGATKPVRHNY